LASADPALYTEEFLGRTNRDYCAWILKPEAWGGAIELSIFAEHYRTEICALDIQTLRKDLYGQGAGYKQRVLLVYDGLHYGMPSGARILFGCASWMSLGRSQIRWRCALPRRRPRIWTRRYLAPTTRP
jgi:hypothetical protein